jgi:protein-S-isoprenylcysteine O-methyltransferase Ste14
MTPFHRIIIALWLLFIIYWAISAVNAKRNVGRYAWRPILARFGILVVFLAALRFTGAGHVWRLAKMQPAVASPLLGAIGVALVVLGLGLAIYARVYLGRNWGMPMSRKEDPEMVTGGPYASVRHPIYSGISLAMLGSAIGDHVLWAVPLVLSIPYFIYSARREEELMREQFGERYRDYMRRTKMIVPFVL